MYSNCLYKGHITTHNSNDNNNTLTHTCKYYIHKNSTLTLTAYVVI